MDLNATLNNAESIKAILEEDLAQLVWELNFRLLSEQGLHERILWVDTAEVTDVSVKKPKQNLFGKIKNLFRGIWKRGRAFIRNANKSKGR
ncbi:MAG: hypothetical protein K2N90_00220 [Lachnospiraceae bacterium]|nr:hypothetical protein [Lachnospiraceae bacterium]